MTAHTPSAGGVSLRLVTEDDAAALTHLLAANADHLAPWEPLRDADHATEPVQRRLLREALRRHATGAVVPLLICRAAADGSEEVVGRMTINDVVRGAFQSAHLGYWVSAHATGAGVGTAAVAAAVRVAFDDLGLHRLQADTLEHNAASRRVLARTGFTEIGRAPRYLRIAGRWQDHVLHQLLDEPAGPAR